MTQCQDPLYQCPDTVSILAFSVISPPAIHCRTRLLPIRLAQSPALKKNTELEMNDPEYVDPDDVFLVIDIPG